MKKLLSTLFVVCFGVSSALAGNQNIANLISSSDWSTLFPNRNVLYSYSNFTTAVDDLSDYIVTYENPGSWGLRVTVERKSTGNKHSYTITTANWVAPTTVVDFENFCNTGDNFNDKRELAAFFSNITKETTGGTTDVFSGLSNSHSQWGLYFTQELGQSCSGYKSFSNADYPPATGACYYGRGPIQLSWNYNYGRFSDFLYGDDRLLTNPDEVHTNGVTSFKSAIWFWMTPQCPKPSCHQVMHEIHDETAGSYSQVKMGKKGFLHTVNIINGAIECRSSANIDKVQLRSDLYSYFMDILGFSVQERTNENTGDYSSLCVEGGQVMQDYSACAFREVTVSCSQPSLGVDLAFCSEPILLNSNVTLKDGETIAWYKDDVLINGATETTYTASSAGTYKAEVTGSCTRTDEVVLSSSNSLEVTASNEGMFCVSGSPSEVTISVSGGEGVYNLYDVETDGLPLKTGSEFTINELDVAQGESVTYYVEEPAGEVYTIGATGRWTDTPSDLNGWVNMNSPAGWLQNTMNFTALADITLQSIKFDIAKGDGDANLSVEILPLNSSTPVASKNIDLEAIDYDVWDDIGGYTAALNFELDAGQYRLNLVGSNVLVQVGQYSSSSGTTFDYDSWEETGVASIDNASNIPNDWGLFQNYMFGAYDWKFSTGGGSGSQCGRTPVVISHDCTVGKKEVIQGSFNVFPNPVNDVMNIAFDGIKVDGSTIEVYNQVGQLLVSKNLNASSGNLTQISTSEFTNGIYFVKVKSDGNEFNSRVIISK